MRRLLLALLLCGCNGQAEEADGCGWAARPVPVSPATGCRLVWADSSEAALVRVDGDAACGGEVCAVIKPGERVSVLTRSEGAVVDVSMEPIDCAAAPSCLTETEDPLCHWQERLTHAIAPADQCARYTPDVGYEEHTRFRSESDASCEAAVSCIIVQPGERANILGSEETRNEVHAAVEYGACDELPPCP